ncbi:hypothetical protein D9V29_11620 [Mycetocola manganoxydans]|uniref:DUF5343 domain-containing protein n=1 Tax=Mycetocola manganoxydans TaxID=699879 RepID=A0A3L6ZMW0_9MICO|nr:hypothetical protein [Mycetocola manganoxydans]RLP69366.1 hypothetical protein D9V29_11620 [Mycetocola manganoxydans]GHD50890.1 hypothetical protein GCM10008097_25360 [Mycetocola manganoxydans]
MVPVKTSVEDIQKLLGYLGKQIGWVEQSKIEKALGSLDDRKVGAIVEFGLILRDGGNLRATERGQLFNSDPQAALREVLDSVELYRATLEWVHYGSRSEATAAEIGQYWEASHADTLGARQGSTLKDGAVCFGRIVDGAGLGSFTVGRGGKETRVSFAASGVDSLVNGVTAPSATDDAEDEPDSPAPATPEAPTRASSIQTVLPSAEAFAPTPSLSVSTSPSVHVNVEIHIAADATSDTVREIFKNMARYVLDKPIADDGE